MPLDGVSEPLVLRRRAACPVPQTKVGRTDGKSAVPRDEYLNQEESYEKEKADKGVPAGGYLIGRHPECGQYYFLLSGVARVCTDHDQTALSKHLPSATAIAYCFAKTRMAIRLLLSKTFRATVHTSTMVLSVETSDVIFMTATSFQSLMSLVSSSDTLVSMIPTDSVSNTRSKASLAKAISLQSICVPRSAAELVMPSKNLRSAERPPTLKLQRRRAELTGCNKKSAC